MGGEAAKNISKSLGAETKPNSKARKGKKEKDEKTAGTLPAPYAKLRLK